MISSLLALTISLNIFHVEPIWNQNQASFHYFDNVEKSVHVYDLKTHKSEVLIDTEKLIKIQKLLNIDSDVRSLVRQIQIHSTNKIKVRHSAGESILSIEPLAVRETKPFLLTPNILREALHKSDSPLRESPSPDSSKVLSLKDSQLAIRTLEGNSNLDGRRLPDSIEWSLYSASWSEDSRYVLAIGRDYSNAQRYPLITNWGQGLPLNIVNIPYVTPVDPKNDFYFSLINTYQKTSKLLYESDSQGRLPEFHSWISEDQFLFSLVDPYYQYRDYYLYTIRKGTTDLVYSQRTDTYLPDFEIAFRKSPLKTYNGSNLAHIIEEKSLGSKLFQINLLTRKKELLLDTPLLIEEIMAYEPNLKEIYFTAFGASKNPHYIHLFKFSNGNLTALTSGEYSCSTKAFEKNITANSVQDSVYLSDNLNWLVANCSSPQDPNKSYLVNLKTGAKTLLGATQHNTNLVIPESFDTTAYKSQERLYGLLYKPKNFDSEKKHPLVYFIYGGPQLSFTPWTYYSTEVAIAQRLSEAGFVVVIADTRGTPDRGKEFRDYNYKKFGQVEHLDHVTIIDYLISNYAFIDKNRLGVFGSSYGGFQTLNLIGRQPNLFKAALANAAVADLREVHAYSVQMFMGDPEQNMHKYEASSVISNFTPSNTKLMILHGAQDTNAPIFAMQKFSQELLQKNIPHNFFIFPQVAHSRTDDVWNKIILYFDENL